jgi:hypothetical protein
MLRRGDANKTTALTLWPVAARRSDEKDFFESLTKDSPPAKEKKARARARTHDTHARTCARTHSRSRACTRTQEKKDKGLFSFFGGGSSDGEDDDMSDVEDGGEITF